MSVVREGLDYRLLLRDLIRRFAPPSPGGKGRYLNASLFLWRSCPPGPLLRRRTDAVPLVALGRARKRMLLIIASVVSVSALAHAETVANPLAQFSGLDKITGLTTQFEIKINEEAKFGSLIVKPFVCNTKPITEEPKTTSFVQVQDVAADGSKKMIFSGWMFAESPGLNAVEHPTFDVWLTGCRDPNAPPPPVETGPPVDPGQVPEEGGGGTVQD
jgi:hypothetical protein